MITALFIGQIFSCSTKVNTVNGTQLTGDLYFKLISVGSFYKADSIAIERFSNCLDSLKSINKDSLTIDDKEAIDIYDGLKEKGLINKPFFHIKLDSGTTYIVYTDTTQYKKIEKFNQQELVNENKKVIIELTGEIVDLGTLRAIDCKTIDKVDKVDGKTYWRK
jgi:hypothetical protein